jgi:hypothetical protein
MATTDFDWSSTRNDIMQRAFRIIGVLPLGDSLSGEQQLQAVQALNDMVKAWQTRHVFLWKVQQLTLSLTTGNATYALPTDPSVIGIEKAWLRISNIDTPV